MEAHNIDPPPANYTNVDRAMYVAGAGLLGLDWLNTKEIVRNPKHEEGNFLLGKHPSQGLVNGYFAAGLLGNHMISKIPDQSLRRFAWTGLIGLQAAAALHNKRAGVELNFKF